MNAPLSSDLPSADIAQRLDRLPVTALHWALCAICTLGVFGDIAEVALSNALSTIFLAPPYKVAQSDLSWLLGAVFAGGAIGAPVLGWLADRHGRRAALQIALAVLFASSLAAAASPNVTWMTVFRFVSGLAIGGYPPLTAAYLSDILPPARRGALMVLCTALAFLGAPAVIFLVRGLAATPLLGLESWRWALIFCAGIVALTAALLAFLPESPRWLAAVGRREEAERACRIFEKAAGIAVQTARDEPLREAAEAKGSFRAIAASAIQRRRLAVIGLIYALSPLATIGFPVLSGAVMVQKGFHVGTSLLFAGLTMFGPTLGNFVMAPLIDRMERRLVLALCAACMILAGLIFAAGSALTPLIVAGIAFNLVAAVYSGALSIYAAELFPTGLRASALSAAWTCGRIVAALVPILLLPLLLKHGPFAMFGAIVAALTATIVLIVVAGPPGLAGKPVAS